MNILIITNGKLPLPAVKGGAVETLLETILNKNEIDNAHKYLVVSSYEQEAEHKSNQFKNSRFFYIKTNTIIFFFKKIYFHIINRYSNNYKGNAFIRELCSMQVLRNNPIDLIIIENIPEYAIPVKKLFPTTNIILHLHNNYFTPNMRFSSSIINSTDHIMVVSEFLLDGIRKLDTKIPISVIRNGVKIDQFKRIQDKDAFVKTRKEYQIQENDFVILYTGRLTKCKGVDILIDVFNSLSYTNIKLVIVGSLGFGQNKSNKFIQDIKEKSSNNKNIIFSGWIDYNRIGLMYSIANLVIVPSICDEAAPLSAIEALVAGVPLISSDSGGLPEYVVGDKNQIINRGPDFAINLKKAIEFMIDNSEDYHPIQSEVFLYSLSEERYYSDYLEIIKNFK